MLVRSHVQNAFSLAVDFMHVHKENLKSPIQQDCKCGLRRRALIKFFEKGQFAIGLSYPSSTVNISYECIKKPHGFTIFS